jgi:hypothetical protein
MLGITWTERWLGDETEEVDQIAWPPRSPDLTSLDFFMSVYVKNIVYQVKMNDLEHLKARIMNSVATVTPNTLEAMWNEVEYCLDFCRATKGNFLRKLYTQKKLRYIPL